jgi:hypothetical protein
MASRAEDEEDQAVHPRQEQRVQLPLKPQGGSDTVNLQPPQPGRPQGGGQEKEEGPALRDPRRQGGGEADHLGRGGRPAPRLIPRAREDRPGRNRTRGHSDDPRFCPHRLLVPCQSLILYPTLRESREPTFHRFDPVHGGNRFCPNRVQVQVPFKITNQNESARAHLSLLWPYSIVKS